MGILEPVTHKEEIQELLDSAQHLYDNANRKLESQKKDTTKKLENLGKTKIQAWACGMDTFVETFSSFKNIEVDKKIDTNLHFIGSDNEPQQMIVNMQSASMTAGEVAKAGFAAIGTGALVGVASYGGAMMFGTASTGTAIAALSGAAKTNATLAWFGGGSLKAGGLGVAGGKLVLAGVVAIPILAVAGIIAGARGKAKLAEAKKVHAQAEEAAAKMDTITTGMKGIATMSRNYETFISKLGRKFKPFIEEMERIRTSHSIGDDGKIDFNSLSLVEQKTLHLSWLMAQVYYHVLSTPILTAEGTVSAEAGLALNASTKELEQIKKDTFKMVGEEAQVADMLWKYSAVNMLVVNLIAMVIFIASGCMVISTSIVKGITCIVCSLVAFPIFFKFKNLPKSRLFVWRLAKLIGAIALLIIVEIILGKVG